MKYLKFRNFALGVLGVCMMLMGNLASASDPASRVLMAYVPEWRRLTAAQIPAEKLTHLLYAFSVVNAQGECTTMGASAYAKLGLNALKELKVQHPHLKVLISVGGWTGSANFSASVLTAESRQKLARSCIDLWIRGEGNVGLPDVIDGIDIDWEFPGSPGESPNYRPEDKPNFVLLMTEFRRQLDALGAASGRRYLLSAAFNVTPTIIAAGYDVAELAKVLDYFNLMTYDLHGGWEPTGPTNFHSALYPAADDPSPAALRQALNVDSAVQRFLAAGAAARQIVVGVPFYGRGWKEVESANNGLFQRADGGIEVPYNQIRARYEPTYQKFRHPEARVPYLFSPETRIFLAYDDPDSAREKAAYAVRQGLAGVMFWEMSMDDPEFSLTTALCAGLGLRAC